MLYFFDSDDGERRIADRRGTDLPGEADALAQALDLLRDLSHGPVAPGAPRDVSVRLRGAGGEALYTATLRLTLDRVG